MILVAFFVLFFALFASVAYGLTARSMPEWERHGPRHVRERTSARNRAVLLVTVVVVAVVAIMEAVVTPFSDAVQNAQFVVGETVGSDPLFVASTGSGTLSWGLYLVILAGVLLGLLVGTRAAAGRYAIMNGTPWGAYFFPSRA